MCTRTLLALLAITFFQASCQVRQPSAHPTGLGGVTPGPQLLNSQNQAYLIITHPSTLWDRQSVAAPEINSVLANWQGRTPEVLMHDRGQMGTYYVPFKSVDILDSPGGAWEFQLQPAVHFTLMGGKLSQCFCETLRDVFRNANEKSHIVVVMTGVFEAIRKRSSEIFSDSELFTLTGFHLADLNGRSDFFEAGDPVLLNSIFRTLGPKRFGAYLASALQGNSVFCTQNSGKQPDVKLADKKLIFSYKGSSIGSLGEGSSVAIIDFQD
jgi:hypothetical protein